MQPVLVFEVIKVDSIQFSHRPDIHDGKTTKKHARNKCKEFKLFVFSLNKLFQFKQFKQAIRRQQV